MFEADESASRPKDIIDSLFHVYADEDHVYETSCYETNETHGREQQHSQELVACLDAHYHQEYDATLGKYIYVRNEGDDAPELESFVDGLYKTGGWAARGLGWAIQSHCGALCTGKGRGRR